MGAAQPQEVVIEQFFDYVDTESIAQADPSQTVQPSIVIDGDSDFMCIWLIADSTGTFDITFADNATGRTFMRQPVHNVNIFGTAQLPFPLLPPYTFRRQGSIGLTITNTSGADNDIQIVFSGKKIFPTLASGAAGAVA
jgi:hypothetical protein